MRNDLDLFHKQMSYCCTDMEIEKLVFYCKIFICHPSSQKDSSLFSLTRVCLVSLPYT